MLKIKHSLGGRIHIFKDRDTYRVSHTKMLSEEELKEFNKNLHSK